MTRPLRRRWPPTKQIFLIAAVSCLGWALDLYDSGAAPAAAVKAAL